MTPNIQVYDVVFIVKTNPEDIEVGDVISYYSTNAFFGNTPITHRVVENLVLIKVTPLEQKEMLIQL